MTYSEELKHNDPIKKASVKLEVLFAERIAKGEFKSYGCDLGYEYVKINADYRT